MPMKLGVDKKLAARGKVGHFACPGDGRSSARTVRVGLAGSVKRPPLSAVVDCPVCGRRHRVGLFWREPTDFDEGREPELLVGAETSEPKSTDQRSPS